MKRKHLLAGIFAITLCIGMMGCGKTEEIQIQEPEASVEEAAEAIEDESATTTEVEAEEDASTNVSLPKYEYPGPELFYTVVYRYVVDEFGANYDAEDVCIPSISEIYLDESDKSDIKLYGDFWVYNYTLEGDTLVNQSGGDYPGVMHIKTSDEGYEVTGFDAVEDGSDFDPTAKEIFGEHYDDFMKVYSDSDAKEQIRAQIISNYVFANNLNITQYQDYGWDPVKLPEENIDSFYSRLD